MKGLKKRRRVQVIVLAAGAMVAAFGAFYLAAPNALQFFRSPSEVVAAPPPATEVFRIGGLVVDGSIVDGEGNQFEFVVTDGGAEVPVKYIGKDFRPDLFDEGQGTVATGRLEDGVFLATKLLAKHDETYMPAEVIDALKDQGVYKDPNG